MRNHWPISKKPTETAIMIYIPDELAVTMSCVNFLYTKANNGKLTSTNASVIIINILLIFIKTPNVYGRYSSFLCCHNTRVRIFKGYNFFRI